MAKTSTGVRGFELLQLGTIGSGNITYFKSGTTGNTSMVVSDFQQKEDSRKRKLRNKLNVKMESSIFQGKGSAGDIALLSDLAAICRAGACDAVLVGMESTYSGVNWVGDVYKFSGSNGLSLGFEYVLNAEGKDAKVMLEAALPYSSFETINTAAKTATHSDTSNFGINFDYASNPILTELEINDTVHFTITDIKDYSLSFKTDGEKSKLANRDQIDWVDVEFMVEAVSADAEKLEDVLAEDKSLKIECTFDCDGLTQEFTFNVNTLTHSTEYTLGDDNRTIKVTFSGSFPLKDFYTMCAAGVATHSVVFDLK